MEAKIFTVLCVFLCGTAINCEEYESGSGMDETTTVEDATTVFNPTTDYLIMDDDNTTYIEYTTIEADTTVFEETTVFEDTTPGFVDTTAFVDNTTAFNPTTDYLIDDYTETTEVPIETTAVIIDTTTPDDDETTIAELATTTEETTIVINTTESVTDEPTTVFNPTTEPFMDDETTIVTELTTTEETTEMPTETSTVVINTTTPDDDGTTIAELQTTTEETTIVFNTTETDTDEPTTVFNPTTEPFMDDETTIVAELTTTEETTEMPTETSTVVINTTTSDDDETTVANLPTTTEDETTTRFNPTTEPFMDDETTTAALSTTEEPATTPTIETTANSTTIPAIDTTAELDCSVTCTGENRTCNASDDCVCLPGYEVPSGELNEPDRPCTEVLNCSVTCTGGNRTCNASDDCVCSFGYEVPIGESDEPDSPCTDIDECLTECKEQGQNCSNTEGSFVCGCEEGYVEDGDACKKVCPASCPVNSTCTLPDDGCVCDDGYENYTSDKGCSDIDECTTECKGDGQNCSNTEGSFVCGCEEGYIEDGDACKKVCPAFCPAHSTCTVPDEGCKCDDGYENYISDNGCTDIDECPEVECEVDHQECSNTEGSYECICEDGYYTDDNGATCKKACPETCPDKSECTAENSKAGCVCYEGYEKIGEDEDETCSDINECDENPDDCNGDGQKCDNLPGTYQCVCSPGYYPDGDSCSEELEECPDCSPHSFCKNPDDGCVCDSGWTKQNGVCVDDDECLTMTLDQTVTCQNLDGSYCCNCITGYQRSEGSVACACDVECEPISCPSSDYPCPEGTELCTGTITFPETLAGYSTPSTDKCADNTTNAGKVYGTRSCSLQGEWAPPVLLSSCGEGIEQLTEKPIETEEERVEVSTNLEVLTSDPEQLEEEDITSSTEVISNVTSAENLTSTVATSVVSSISNIMESPSLASSGQAETLLAQIDDVAAKVILNGTIPYQAVSKNISLFIAEAGDTNIEGVGIAVLVRPNTTSSGFRSDSIQSSNGSASAGGILSENQVQASIHVPTTALGNSSRVAIYVFGNNNLFPRKNSSTFLAGMPVSSSATLNSLVLSATVENETISNLPSGENLTYSTPIDNTTTGDVPVCAYWSEDAGQWFTDGCEVDYSKTTNTSIACTCSHLTNFATLMDIGGATAAIYALDVITIVGSSISSVALLLVIAVFIFFPSTRKGRKFRPSFLLLNLSIALLGLNMTLLVSEMPFLTDPINYINYPTLDSACIAVAAIIHFFMLCSCAWMNGEAAIMFLAVTKPLYTRCELRDKNVIIFSSLWGWLMPAVFVGIVLGVDRFVYLYPYEEGDQEVTCWITNDMIVYLAVIPVAIMMGVNLIVYAILTYKLCRNANSNWGATWRSIRDSQRKKIAVNICIVITLGLTWVFGFFVAGISDETTALVFAYIFTILNSFQGLFLFIIYIVRNKETRDTVARGISSITGTIGFGSSTSGPRPTNTRSSDPRTFGSSMSHNAYEIQQASLRSRVTARGRRSSSLSDISLSDFAMAPGNGTRNPYESSI